MTEAANKGGALRSEIHFGRRMLCFSERPDNLAAMFAATVRRWPHRPALVEGESTSYAELDLRAAKIAASLRARGIGPGDRVAFYLGNCVEFVATFLACTRSGFIVVPIGIRQQRPELEFLLADSGARAILFEASLAAMVPGIDEAGGGLIRISVHGPAEGAEEFDALLQADPDAAPNVAIGEDEPAVILYTSGTTGKPKGAQLTHLGMLHTVLTFARCYDLDENDRGLVAVPLSHVTGLVAVMLTMLGVGGCAILMRRDFKAGEFLELASRERITYTLVVPTIYTLCAMHPDFALFDLSAWRVGSFGGAPMPVPTIKAFADRLPQLELLNAYGATETTSPATVMPRAFWRERMDSVGQAVPCGEIRVVDDAGAIVAPGEPGELLIAGPMVVPGYWNRPDANASEFVDGFWRSGDIGSKDADGFVKVFDRKKDMLNRGGFKVFCAEVENVLCGLDGVAECAVIGRPDPVLGERVHAIVVPRENSALTAEAIRQFCGARMADYKVPEIVTLQAEPLPRNANGKVQKVVLRKLFAVPA
jgi:long-chain acyl-CoA synthetase